MAKKKIEEEIVEMPTILEVEKEEVVVKTLVDLDKIINVKTKEVIESVSDSAIKETFDLLGLKLDFIETTINQYASQELLQGLLLLIAELDCVFDKEAKKNLVHKIVPYLKK